MFFLMSESERDVDLFPLKQALQPSRIMVLVQVGRSWYWAMNYKTIGVVLSYLYVTILCRLPTDHDHITTISPPKDWWLLAQDLEVDTTSPWCCVFQHHQLTWLMIGVPSKLGTGRAKEP